ncbi:DNA translocase FtsK [Sporosarcina limicola]|uniref:S-DNA-T family DNA segregation ATPase FtsK/SpoIIIE n=1 Tax=Sporosarcina limicola TaxID=34101 RepID=A0A927MLI0_9BACL|nr:DNA translocase FtsK [Sporosarcina limicola]MBE1553406.1 S-DNA-T family DNA segregation ATPase FtsK/SpoIIIE [Sporosarcina limicola]
MAKKAKKKKKNATAHKKNATGLNPLIYEVLGLAMIGLAVIIIFEFGIVGRGLSSLTRFIFGNWYGALPLLLIVQALMFMIKRKAGGWKNRIVGGSLFILASLILFSHIYLFKELYESRVLMSDSALKETWKVLVTNDGITSRSGALGGGMAGAILFAMFHSLFDSAGATVAGVLLFLIGLVLLTGKAFVPYLAEYFPKLVESMKGLFLKKEQPVKAATTATRASRSKKKGIQVEDQHSQDVLIAQPEIEEVVSQPIISAFSERIDKPTRDEQAAELEVADPEQQEIPVEIATYTGVTGEKENESYVLPPATLLKQTPHNDQSEEYDSIQANAQKLERTFQSFGVKAKVTQVHLGPAVTKYEVLPDTGVKVSRIVSLSDDIALALAASGIRIEAPIPGKSAIGIEVPNSSIAVVSLREVIEAKENNRPESKLMISLGRDVTGQAMLTELNKMPHVLIAGSTGSGKSVCINGIIVSILMRAKPHEVKMMMIDPKMVELNVYNGVPHLLAPVVTDPRKASQALKKVVSEMERRYELFSHTGTRNIEGYNEHIDEWNEANDEKHPRMPYIVVIVDELADLMMVASSDVEDSITRLAQMARASGIHLIIATQRPSVDVITGIIKANIPSRIAFAVSSAIDSRTILDGGGAEKLLGRGDMLFLPAGVSKPVRIQGAFVSDSEVEAIVDFVIEQQKAQYQEEMIPTDIEVIPAHEETDELYDEAVQLVTEIQTASVSMLQRRFRVGYSRAARIVDQMEMRGVVGPPEGSKPRQVLISRDEGDRQS